MLLGEVGEPTEVGEGATRGMDPQDIFVKEVFLGGHLYALGSDWPSPTSVGMAVILGGGRAVNSGAEVPKPCSHTHNFLVLREFHSAVRPFP